MGPTARATKRERWAEAFAAILNDGRAVAWGEPEEGGDASEVKAASGGLRASRCFIGEGW